MSVKWGTSILLSVFVGTALNINAYIPPLEEHITLRRWAIFRFYIIPFCVSSYSNVSFYYNFIALFPVHDFVTGVIGIGLVVGLGIILVLIRLYIKTFLEARLMEEEISLGMEERKVPNTIDSLKLFNYPLHFLLLLNKKKEIFVLSDPKR